MSPIKKPKDVAHARDFQIEPSASLPPFLRHLIEENAGEHEQLPSYSGGNNGFPESIEQLANTLRAENSNNLPITTYPTPNDNIVSREDQTLERRKHLVDMYFDSIRKADVEMISSLLHAEIVRVETPNEAGKTPLLAAVEAGKAASVRCLLEHGADINAYGITASTPTKSKKPNKSQAQHTFRTPLQYAAQLGNLTLVKLLLEHNADDALIAPDGQLALRLAATNNHRDIVDYLPERRGGGFKRWKTKHATAMRRCRKSAHSLYSTGKFIIYDAPRFFVWTVPKHLLVRPLARRLKWLHEHWGEVPGLLLKMLKKAPFVILSIPLGIGMAAWDGIKALPEFFKELGEVLKGCGQAVWRTIKGVPNGVKIALVWIWTGVRKTGSAIGNVFASVVSFLHTVGAAIAGFFQRITLKDIGRGFVACLRAIFIEAPKKIWSWLRSFSETMGKVLEAMFGCLGWCVWGILRGIWKAILYVPKKLGEMLAACGSSLRSGGKEVLVWVDPKRA